MLKELINQKFIEEFKPDMCGIGPFIPHKDTDFSDIWWVGDRSDGGLVAICLRNALSTGGFSLQTTKNGKGQIAVTNETSFE